MRVGFVLLLAAVSVGTSQFSSASSTISAGSVTGLTVFGDSLSDSGNASIFTVGLEPGAGYYYRNLSGVPFPVGEFTNPPAAGGPTGIWVDQFAARTGLSSTPFLAGGSNFATGSAHTSGLLPQDMNNQVNLFLATHLFNASPTSLYSFWGGGDDILGNLANAATIGATAANNVAGQIQDVAAAGGKNFIWFNLPNLGDVPALAGNTPAQIAASLASQDFNAQWATDLAQLNASGINVIGVDIDALFNQILANPGAFGYTDITDACMVTAGCNPNTFLYWDGIHPTSYTDSLVATLAYDDVFGAPTATPEPSTWMLVGAAAIGLFLLRRRFLPV